MAVNAYLKIEGIDGPSTSNPNHIDILSFSWGVSQTATYGAGASGQEAKAGRANFSDLSIMKVLDKTSPALADACARGMIIPSVYILYDKPIGASGATQASYYRLYLKDALITSVQVSGSSENPSESVTFAYQAVEYAYNPEDDKGNLAGWVPKGYDLEHLQAGWTADTPPPSA